MINYAILKKNTEESFNIGNLSKFKERNINLNIIDPKNQLNQLTISEWIRHTRSYHIFQEHCDIDNNKKRHPATFEEELPFYYIEFFTKENESVFDPFMGTGSTNIAANTLNRKSIGIELNKAFFNIAEKRFNDYGLNKNRHIILCGDCRQILRNKSVISLFKERSITLTITSPPYYNILKKTEYTKKQKGGFIDYGNDKGNLELISSYEKFLDELVLIFDLIYFLMKDSSYLVINVQNFYTQVKFKNDKFGQQIVFFAWDLAIKISKRTRWIPCCEQVWCNPNKRLFPFGSPYLYLANVCHSYNLIFWKKDYRK